MSSSAERSSAAPSAKRLLALDYSYLGLALVLLLIEVAIALWVRDAWIRPHGGDVLVVILIYCFVKGVARLPVVPTALGVLVFSFLVEVLQGLDLVGWLGLADNVFWSTVIGTSLQWLDFASYTLGVLIVLLVEWRLGRLGGAATGQQSG